MMNLWIGDLGWVHLGNSSLLHVVSPGCSVTAVTLARWLGCLGYLGFFFCLPSWRDWDQVVDDDLFHVWQLLLTFGWVICLQQAGDQVLKAARENVGPSV